MTIESEIKENVCLRPKEKTKREKYFKKEKFHISFLRP